METSLRLEATTRAVLLDIGNALSKRRFRVAAAQLLDALEHDPQVECAPLTDEHFEQAGFRAFLRSN